MEDIYIYIDKLIEEIKGSKKSFLGGKSIDEARCIELINAIDAHMPSIIKEAEYVVRDCDQIIKGANMDGQRIIFEAKEEANRILDQNEIITEAQRRANEIMDKAENYAAMLEAEAKRRADEIYARSEDFFGEVLHQIRNGREEMLGGLVTKNHQKKQYFAQDNNIDQERGSQSARGRENSTPRR